jgi:hypothetical protein
VIPDDAQVAADLYKLLRYAEAKLGGAATIELDQEGVPRASWMIPFRGVLLILHPVVGPTTTVQLAVYKDRDTTLGRQGRIIWSPDLNGLRSHRGSGPLHGDELLPAADEAVQYLQRRPIKPFLD